MNKLTEGQIMLSNNIRADIELTITYKIKDSYYCVSTEDMGGGNYISIRGINDDDMDKSVKIEQFEDLFFMIKHFKKSYEKLVINSKMK